MMRVICRFQGWPGYLTYHMAPTSQEEEELNIYCLMPFHLAGLLVVMSVCLYVCRLSFFGLVVSKAYVFNGFEKQTKTYFYKDQKTGDPSVIVHTSDLTPDHSVNTSEPDTG